MTHRIDDYLDGALDRIALTPDERAEADALERAIEETRTFVDGKPVPDLTADIMRRVRTVDRPEPRRTPMFARLVRVLWGPREIYFEFRPAYAIAGAIAVALLVIFTPSLRQSLPNARLALYASIGGAILTVVATNRLFDVGGVGILIWFALLALCSYGLYWVWLQYRSYG